MILSKPDKQQLLKVLLDWEDLNGGMEYGKHTESAPNGMKEFVYTLKIQLIEETK